MNIKASGRSAVILATGLCIGFAGAALAAGDAAASLKPDAAASSTAINNSVKHTSRHLKKEAHRKSGRIADPKASDTAAAAGGNSPEAQPSPISDAVANANAQLPSAETPAGSAQAMSDRASNILTASPDSPDGAQPIATTPVVAADQLNDVDRTLRETAPSAVTVASADEAPPVVAASRPATTAGSDNSTWDQTSLIGKIFIGFGALLTMASAARMFMA